VGISLALDHLKGLAWAAIGSAAANKAATRRLVFRFMAIFFKKYEYAASCTRLSQGFSLVALFAMIHDAALKDLETERLSRPVVADDCPKPVPYLAPYG
jgi:hypothetical protein